MLINAKVFTGATKISQEARDEIAEAATALTSPCTTRR